MLIPALGQTIQQITGSTHVRHLGDIHKSTNRQYGNEYTRNINTKKKLMEKTNERE